MRICAGAFRIGILTPWIGIGKSFLACAGYSELRVPVSEVKATIFGHAEFTTFNETVTTLFKKWRKANTTKLNGITIGDKPKTLISTLSESLLETFSKAPLVDAYDVYQHLMDQWETSMQDDLYLLVQEGWTAVVEGNPNTDLIPQSLMMKRYFAKEQAAVETLEAARDTITRQLEELDEEHGGEEGLLAEAKTDKGKLTKASVKARLADVGMDKSAKDEWALLSDVLKLFEQEAAASKQVKDAQKALDAKVAGHYGKLTEAGGRNLVDARARACRSDSNHSGRRDQSMSK
jgi:type I restriction enzyme M protein